MIWGLLSVLGSSADAATIVTAHVFTHLTAWLDLVKLSFAGLQLDDHAAEAALGFPLFKSGGDRLGWLFNMNTVSRPHVPAISASPQLLPDLMLSLTPLAAACTACLPKALAQFDSVLDLTVSLMESMPHHSSCPT